MKINWPSCILALPDTPGIYVIKNMSTGECYVGGASMVQSRARQHLRLLQTNYHHSKIMQASWNNHGESAFAFELLEHCDLRKLNARELHWFNELKPVFNLRPPAPIIRRGNTLLAKQERLERSKVLLQGAW